MKLHTKATSALVALAGSISIMPSQLTASNIRQVSNLSRQCGSGKQSACRELSKIAVEDKDASVRRAAVSNLTDQSLLARIILEDRDAGIRSVAVSSLTDQTLLAKIAMESMDAGVRIAALAKLTDQSELVKIALESTDASVRRTAVAKVIDQPVLVKSLLADKDAGVRSAAVANLTDQASLAKIAMESTDASVHRTALAKLSDRSLRAQIVGQDIKSINARVSTDAVTFGAVATITVNKDGWIAPGGFQMSQPRTVAPNDNQSFLIVETAFEPSHPLELAASDVRLVVPSSQMGAPEAFGVLGETSWQNPKDQKVLISGKRTMTWLFVVGRNSDIRQFKLSVLGAELSLGSAQK